ncbi:MAG: group I intron-associated PD-(D/E)XK endonuclease [Egibacteraceae bacterium]
MTPSEIGERAEAAVIHALARAGKRILIPLSGSARYDLVFEDDDGFHRVQCKTARVFDEAVFFRTCSQTGGVLKGYRGEIDFFGVYCAHREEVYLVPVDEVPERAAHLRLGPTRNGQEKSVRWAADYRLGEEATHR